MGRKAFAAILVGLALAWILLEVSLNRLVLKNLPAFRQQIAAALGRQLAFDDLQFSVWKGFSLSASNLRVADDPHFAATPFIEAKELRMPIRWGALLRGKIEISKYVLKEPEIQIIRNETGDLNILSRAIAQAGSQSYFFTPPVEVENGKIYFVDRSVKAPVEITVPNLSMDLSDYDSQGGRRLRVTANFFSVPGQEKNFSLDGWIKPSAAARDWSSFPIDIWIKTDGMLITNLARAVPILRESITTYLDIAGPVMLEARVRGSVSHPHIRGLKLTGAFFGSTKNNVALTGDIDCSVGESCPDPSLNAEIRLSSVELERLRKIPFLEPAVPQDLSAEGPLNLRAELTGKRTDLKVQAHIQANESVVRFGHWLEKPRRTPVSLELDMVVQKDRTILKNSLLRLHNLKLWLSGVLESSPKRQLTLHLRNDGVELAGWEKILPPISRYRLQGKTEFVLSVVRSLASQDPAVTIHGRWNFDNFTIQDKASPRRLAGGSAELVFTGNEARLVDSSFRLGSTPMKLQGVLHNFSDPVFQYVLQSAKLNLSDIDEVPSQANDVMMAFHGTGEIRAGNGRPSIQSAIASPEGSWQGLPYRNLNVEAEWSAQAIKLRKLSFESLGGSLVANGRLGTSENGHLPFDLIARTSNLDLTNVMKYNLFNLPYSVDGSLSVDVELHGKGGSWNETRQTLMGKARLELSRGTLKNFNLAGQVLTDVNGLPGVVNLASAITAVEKELVLENKDTVFDSLEASFAVEAGRFSTKNLTWVTKDYTVTGEGWIDLNRATRWNATLVMQADFSKAVAQEHKNVRFLLDRSGRLVIPFRAEGTVPHVQVKPDVRRLTESIQKGLLGLDSPPRQRGAAAQQKRRSK
jgi:AsmA-like C-terminal region/AsmA family